MKIVGRKYGFINGTALTSSSTCVLGATYFNGACGSENAESTAGAFGTDPSATHSNYIGTGPNGTGSCNNTAQPQDDGYCAYGIPSIVGNAAQGTVPYFGDTAHIGTERAPAFRGADAAVIKDFQVYRGNMVEFTAHAYNVGNITSYNNPNVIINGGNNWGIVQSTRSQQRQLELELKYKF